MCEQSVMRRIGFIVVALFIFTGNSVAQETVDHWESLVNAENMWRYFPGASEPPGTWIDIDFDDNIWNEGPGGIGYGDEDDGTSIGATGSVYLRIKFTVTDLNQLEQALLLADYDDAYVAYLNGQEISRGGISGARPPYNQFADSAHEADLYQGFYPSEVFISKSGVEQHFLLGENVLAVQVHNINTTSSDLSSNFYLLVGINISGNVYQQVPPWFRAPINFESSNLPIIKIDTKGSSILDEPKIAASMGIVDNGFGNINHTNDAFNDYDGPIGIELRGSSSQALFPKKQYAVELWTNSGQDTSASILGLPEEEDWVLYAPYSDKSLIRNLLTYKLGENLGWYAPRTRLVELYLNESYQGVYMLTEKIKRDKNRVDISKLNPDENSGNDLTGGYIVKLDKYDGPTQGLGWDSPIPPPRRSENQLVHYQYHYPKEDEITFDQQNYIQNYITDFEQSLNGPKYRDIREGYKNYINVESFIDFSIINELTKNVDGYRLSTFIYKDKDSEDDKLYLGPIWDFNLAFGNANYCEGAETQGWAWDFNTICNGDWWLVPFWWRRLLRDPEYVIQYQNRWGELRTGVFSNESILNYIDSTVTVLDEPQQRNFTKWPILNEHIWPNNYVGGSYENEIYYLKTWIIDRLAWLDSNIAALDIITDLYETELSAKSFTIYPNPNNGNFNINIPGSRFTNLNLMVHDKLGRIIHHESINVEKADYWNCDLNKLSDGLYFVKISNGDQLLYTEKIIVN